MVEYNGSTPLENDKYEMFAQHYVSNNNQVESAKMAGYKGKGIATQASRMMNNDKIKARINYLRNEILKQVQEEQIDVIKELTDIARQENEHKYGVNARLKALELIAKSQGLFIERREVKSEVNVNDMSKYSDEELDKMLQQYETDDNELTN